MLQQLQQLDVWLRLDSQEAATHSTHQRVSPMHVVVSRTPSPRDWRTTRPCRSGKTLFAVIRRERCRRGVSSVIGHVESSRRTSLATRLSWHFRSADRGSHAVTLMHWNWARNAAVIVRTIRSQDVERQRTVHVIFAEGRRRYINAGRF